MIAIAQKMKTALSLGDMRDFNLENKWMPLLSRVVPRVT
jgi:hypothetical protein